MSALPDRYQDLGLLGVGGMGEVRRVRDTLLRSVVAMKVALPHVSGDPVLRRRFLDEARLTAQLHHPAILAVHDLGALADGRPFFTMEEVRGRTLGAALPELDVRHAVRILHRSARAVGYAHGQGVVHRDLKPENVMIAAHDEVRVTDWGLARRLDDEDELALVDLGPRERTQAGQVLGTLAWMPPEQARGQLRSLGPEADVYALGAILYALLARRPPYEGPRAWHDLLAGPPAPLEVGPATLRGLCARAMARRPSDRTASADGFADELEGWLDEDRALRRVDEARALLPRWQALSAEAVAADEEARTLLAEVPTWAPAERKVAGWRAEDRAAERRREARRVEVAFVQRLRGALLEAPGLAEAHALLAAHHRARHADAERRGDQDAAAELEALVREHDRGEHAAWLQGDGRVTLVTDPPARVTWFRIVERDRRWVAEREGPLGHTPLREARLPRGSHLLVLEADGCVAVRYPLYVDRAAHWDGVAPGEQAPRAIRLPRLGELGPDDRLVPAGWFWSGGDPDAPDALPPRRLWASGFVLRRHPVTVAEYLRFLADLDEPVDPWLPRDAGAPAGSSLFRPAAAGGWEPDPAAAERARPDAPVTDVDWWSARRYAAWEAARTGLPWRLPHELEWEKAARGVDRRRAPWGDHLEPTWARIAGSSEGPPSVAPVDACPTDESLYGVCGLAGNVRDWCGSVYARRGLPPGEDRVPGPMEAEPPVDAFLAMRGGAWPSTLGQMRSAGRFADTPGRRYRTLGFRLCRSFA